MTTEAVEALQVFRAVTVEHRRQLVRNLAVPTDRGGAQDLREMFLKMQMTIEAIDRAIKEESADVSGAA